jgi:hypothetical protein
MIVEPWMMETYEMLLELREMVDDGEIYNDECDHDSPADTHNFCRVCFILNLSDHVSGQDPEFSDETTDAQREAIESLWERFANQ